jgi:hypothetical protein
MSWQKNWLEIPSDRAALDISTIRKRPLSKVVDDGQISRRGIDVSWEGKPWDMK